MSDRFVTSFTGLYLIFVSIALAIIFSIIIADFVKGYMNHWEQQKQEQVCKNEFGKIVECPK
jgi:hypothetical protein